MSWAAATGSKAAAAHMPAAVEDDDACVICLEAQRTHALVQRLMQAWPEMPPLESLACSAILGFFRVKDVVPVSECADDPQAVGPWCWRIDKVITLKTPFRMRHRAAWVYVVDNAKTRAFIAAQRACAAPGGCVRKAGRGRGRRRKGPGK